MYTTHKYTNAHACIINIMYTHAHLHTRAHMHVRTYKYKYTHAHLYTYNVHAHTMYISTLLAIVSGVISAPFPEESLPLRRDKDDNITTPHPYRHSSPLRCGPH